MHCLSFCILSLLCYLHSSVTNRLIFRFYSATTTTDCISRYTNNQLWKSVWKIAVVLLVIEISDLSVVECKSLIQSAFTQLLYLLRFLIHSLMKQYILMHYYELTAWKYIKWLKSVWPLSVSRLQLWLPVPGFYTESISCHSLPTAIHALFTPAHQTDWLHLSSLSPYISSSGLTVNLPDCLLNSVLSFASSLHSAILTFPLQF